MFEHTTEYWKGKFELYKKLHPEEFKDFGKKYTPMRCDLCPYFNKENSPPAYCPDPFLLLFPDGSVKEDTMENFRKRPSFTEGWCIEWIKHV